MAKPQTLAEYHEATGRRFRRTKDQMRRGLDRDASFKEWVATGAMPSKAEDRAKRPPDRPRIRRTKLEVKQGLTIEEAFEARKKAGKLDKAKDDIRETRGYVCGQDDRNCQLARTDPDFEDVNNQCVGFKLYKDDDDMTVIVNCVCECHSTAFEINRRKSK